MASPLGGATRSRPILLLADQAWDTPGGGAVILRSLLGDKTIGDGVLSVTPSRPTGEAVRGHYGLTSGSAGRGRFSILADTLRHSGRLAAEVEALAAKENAAAIWAVLHGSTVAIAAQLARRSSRPMHVTVHDDPVYATALRSRRLALFAPLIARQFRTALTAARSVDVVCEAMAERYRRKFGVRGTVLHRGLPDPVTPGPAYDPLRQGLSVGIMGNTYGYHQLLALGKALVLAAASLKPEFRSMPPRIVICGHSYGDRLKREFGGNIEVDVAGHVDEAEGIDRLRRCAAVYLNYPFGWFGRVLRETSFPTKLSTYVYAARPLLIHAPKGSSVSGLSKEFGDYVMAWESMDPAEGGRLLATRLADARTLASYHEPADGLRLRYYNLDVHRQRLHELLKNLIDSPAGMRPS